MTEEALRNYFHANLQWLGYEIEQTNPLFDRLFALYKDGTLYEEVQTEFLPVYLWHEQAKAILAPYMTFRPGV